MSVSLASEHRTLLFFEAVIRAVERAGGEVVVHGKNYWREVTLVRCAEEEATTLRVRDRPHGPHAGVPTAARTQS